MFHDFLRFKLEWLGIFDCLVLVFHVPHFLMDEISGSYYQLILRLGLSFVSILFGLSLNDFKSVISLSYIPSFTTTSHDILPSTTLPFFTRSSRRGHIALSLQL